MKTLNQILLTVTLLFPFLSSAEPNRSVRLQLGESVVVSNTTISCGQQSSGTCNAYGCSSCGTCSAYGCPRCNSGYSGGSCNAYGCWDGASGAAPLTDVQTVADAMPTAAQTMANATPMDVLKR